MRCPQRMCRWNIAEAKCQSTSANASAATYKCPIVTDAANQDCGPSAICIYDRHARQVHVVACWTQPPSATLVSCFNLCDRMKVQLAAFMGPRARRCPRSVHAVACPRSVHTGSVHSHIVGPVACLLARSAAAHVAGLACSLSRRGAFGARAPSNTKSMLDRLRTVYE